MKRENIIILVLFLFWLNGLYLYSQKLDSTLIDNNSLLNKNESDFLNIYFENQRNTFDFSQKKIVFVSGSSGSRIISKKGYFHGVDLSDNKETNGQSLIILTPEEKAQSGGYDAMILYWVKLFTNHRKQRIIKELKICR